jgi:putative nucleotidyltransferase with HDIG domain
MPNPARLFLAGVVLIAAAVLLAEFIFAGSVSAELAGSWIGLAWCVVIAVVAEVMAVDFKVGPPGQKAHSSLAFLPFLSALTLFSVNAAVIVVVIVCVISQFVVRRGGDLLKRLFNVSQGALSAYVAGSLFRAIVGGAVQDIHWSLLSVGFAALAASFFLTNMMLNSVALALLKQANIVDVFRQVVGPGAANLRYDLLASPIALVPAVLYGEAPVTGMLLILLPLLLIQYSYLSKKQVIDRSNDLLRALVTAIETRDPYTSGHSIRVSTLAKLIAKDLGLSLRRVNEVELAALLHDIGKIHAEFAVVLSKPYDLTTEERALIQTHAARGADLLEELRSVPTEVVASVRHHHERYDGCGYPDGIAGFSIPLAARIIMLCDSIDAMLSDRPYRKALTVNDVRDEIHRCAGTQFDPDIVKVVLACNTLERAVELIAADYNPSALDHVLWS